MIIYLRRIPGFKGCQGIWLFISIRDRTLVILAFNRYHADIEVNLDSKQLVLGPSIQHRFEG